MELVIIAILSVLLPIMTITAFVIGYNANAPKKILKHTLNYVAKISNYRVHLESRFSTEVLAFYTTGSGNTVLAKK